MTGMGNSLLYLPDDLQINGRGIHLLAGAAMNRNRRSPSRLATLCNLYGVFLLFLPTGTDFYRYRDINGPHGCFYDRLSRFRAAHKGRAAPAAHDFRRRAAHVDINCLWAVEKRFLGGFCHDGRIVAKELDRCGAFRLR